MSRTERAKGSRGQREAQAVLESHGYHVSPLACGHKVEDLIADYDGCMWSVEVKHHEVARWNAFIAQAKEQAKKRGLPWMLMVRIPSRPHTFVCVTADDERIMRMAVEL